MSQINSPKVTPELEEVIAMIVKHCADQGICLSGFLFDHKPPFILYFGTVKEKGPDLTALHLQLCDQYDAALEKQKQDG